jgi:RNA polymerase sigma factor (sigma-70 family)
MAKLSYLRLRKATAPNALPPRALQGAGRSETLGQVYIRQYDEMLEFLLRRTGDMQVSQELAQDVWIRISAQLDDASIENPHAWLRRIAVNLAINWLKANRFRTGMLASEFDLSEIADRVGDGQPDLDRIVHGRRGLDYMCELIDQLPPRRRAVFLLYRERGLSLRETADELGISIKTAKGQMTEALKFLRQKMSDAGLWP